MPTYKQNNQSLLPAKAEQSQPRRMVRIPLNGPLELGIVLDASGSMADLKGAVIAGFNSLVREQKADARFNLALFNSTVKFLHRNTAIKNLVPLSDSTYETGGQTALLDGIGYMICEIGDRFDELVVKPRVLIAILTDGLENCSLQFPVGRIADMIKRRRTFNRWEFIYLTQGDAGVAYAIRLGIPKNNIVRFDVEPDAIKALLCRLSLAVRSYQLGDRNFAKLLLENKK